MLERDIVSHSIVSILIAKEFQVEWHKALVVCWMFILISDGFRFVTNAVLCKIVFPGSECDAKRMKSEIYIYGVLPATLVLSWLGLKAKISIGHRQSPNWRTHTYTYQKNEFQIVSFRMRQCFFLISWFRSFLVLLAIDVVIGQTNLFIID